MPTAFEDDDGTWGFIDPSRKNDDEEEEPPLEDFDAPEATGKILPGKIYPQNKTPPDDVDVDSYTQRPVVRIVVEEGKERVAYIINVQLPPKGKEFSSPEYGFLSTWEPKYVETRRAADWKLRKGSRPYWIWVGEIGASEGFVREHWEHVLDVTFRNDVIPDIAELTHGTPFDSVEKTGDMRERTKPIIEHPQPRTIIQRITDAIKRLFRGG